MVTAQPSGYVHRFKSACVRSAGDGHFSPVGGYSEAEDMVLILDTARFKYPPHWVPLEMLYKWVGWPCCWPDAYCFGPFAALAQAGCLLGFSYSASVGVSGVYICENAALRGPATSAAPKHRSRLLLPLLLGPPSTHRE
jgi:hypothetical protein